ncbi:MAG: amidohydrolase [Bryobacteraceae bacterium]|nr:amidohydrolase [Bryobacteraceae bacterium]
MREISRRGFLAAAATSALGADEAVIDIHQHTNYAGRSDEDLVAHQRRMGIAKTVLLPAGSKYGLDAKAGGNDTVMALSRRYPGEFAWFANELPDLPETRRVIESYLKRGAIGIGEQKFRVDCDSREMQALFALAAEYGVPVLMHFQHETYNTRIERFHKMLEKYPRVNFIGHAQTWWGNIDKKLDQAELYPKGKVTPGGITDRLLADYPNIYGDLSAGSGLNAMRRDEEHARAFLYRHQDKLLYGSDCDDRVGEGDKCSGSQQLALVRKLVDDPAARRKILFANATRVMKIG